MLLYAQSISRIARLASGDAPRKTAKSFQTWRSARPPPRPRVRMSGYAPRRSGESSSIIELGRFAGLEGAETACEETRSHCCLRGGDSRCRNILSACRRHRRCRDGRLHRGARSGRRCLGAVGAATGSGQETECERRTALEMAPDDLARLLVGLVRHVPRVTHRHIIDSRAWHRDRYSPGTDAVSASTGRTTPKPTWSFHPPTASGCADVLSIRFITWRASSSGRCCRTSAANPAT